MHVNDTESFKLQPSANRSPSPIGWERVGVRVSPTTQISHNLLVENAVPIIVSA